MCINKNQNDKIHTKKNMSQYELIKHKEQKQHFCFVFIFCTQPQTLKGSTSTVTAITQSYIIKDVTILCGEKKKKNLEKIQTVTLKL